MNRKYWKAIGYTNMVVFVAILMPLTLIFGVMQKTGISVFGLTIIYPNFQYSLIPYCLITLYSAWKADRLYIENGKLKKREEKINEKISDDDIFDAVDKMEKV